MNPAHANIQNPKLWEAEIDAVAVHDGTKGGSHKMTLLQELPLPAITMNQRVAFGIYCVLEVVAPDSKFEAWAENWLNGKNRTRADAYADSDAAAYAASTACFVARSAAAGEGFLLIPAKKAMEIK